MRQEAMRGRRHGFLRNVKNRTDIGQTFDLDSALDFRLHAVHNSKKRNCEAYMFGNRIRLFSLFGFEVRMDLSWLVIAVLVVWSLAKGYFPYMYRGLPAKCIGTWGWPERSACFCPSSFTNSGILWWPDNWACP